jgi:hypothetical protein
MLFSRFWTKLIIGLNSENKSGKDRLRIERPEPI